MNHSARRKMLRFLGTIIVVLLPVLLALWFAHFRAVSETRNQLHTFAQLVLDKTELVILQADLARDAAEQYQGKACTSAHQQRMLNIIRGRLYINELIYAEGERFLCSTVMTPDSPYFIPRADYKRKPDIAIYYYRDTPFFPGYKMTYMQRGHYVAVINPLSYSEVMSDDTALAWGMYDTLTNTFFSLSELADVAQLSPLVQRQEPIFQQGDRVYSLVKSARRPIAAIVSTSKERFYQNRYHQLTLTLPLGIICSVLVLFMWSRSRQAYHAPRQLLQRAINQHQLCLHYQPIIDIRNGTCVGAEALLRWPGYDGPVMSPDEFIPLAEKEGMMEQVTHYVVEEVFNDLGYFLATHSHLYVSINLSAADFLSSRLIALIREKTRQYSVLAQQIKVEVTERGFIDVPKMTPIIQAFRQAGYEVAIDDFGTGYSNLHNLYSLNVDLLKIDKSFVDTLTTNSTSHLIVEHIIEMAQSLRLKIIAEGVETAEQVSWLLKRGVQYCQGWHFAKALPPHEFIVWLQQSPAPLTIRGQASYRR
ncbi:TPA: EAL domain-containing protein [Salmonella enterica]|nr:EAL domain-containing protein [Salmonella enterica]